LARRTSSTGSFFGSGVAPYQSGKRDEIAIVDRKRNLPGTKMKTAPTRAAPCCSFEARVGCGSRASLVAAAPVGSHGADSMRSQRALAAAWSQEHASVDSCYPTIVEIGGMEPQMKHTPARRARARDQRSLRGAHRGRLNGERRCAQENPFKQGEPGMVDQLPHFAGGTGAVGSGRNLSAKLAARLVHAAPPVARANQPGHRDAEGAQPASASKIQCPSALRGKIRTNDRAGRWRV